MRNIKDYTDKYVDEPFESTIVKIRKKTVIEQCKKYKHDHILEIGCGMDPFFVDFTDFKRMIISEPGDLFADNAEKLAEDANYHVKIVRGFFENEIEKINELGIALDFIILSSVLHELDEPQKMLGAIKQLCTKNTIVHINVPNANSLHRLIAKEAGLIKDIHEQSAQMQKMQRRRTYDKDLLKEEVENAGFEILDEGSYFIKPFTHGQMQSCMDDGIIDEQVIQGLERVIKYLPELGAGIYVNVRKK